MRKRTMNFWFFLVSAVLAPLVVVLRSSGSHWGHVLRPGAAQSQYWTMLVELRYGDLGFNFPDLALATQTQLDSELARRNSSFRYELIDNLKVNQLNISLEFDVDFLTLLFIYQENSVMVHPSRPEAMITYDVHTVHANDLPYFIVEGLVDHFLAADLDTLEIEDTRSLKLELAEHVTNDKEIKLKILDKLQSIRDIFPFVAFEFLFFTSDNEISASNRFWYSTSKNDTLGFYIATDNDVDAFVHNVTGAVAHLLGVSVEPGNNLSLRVNGYVKRLVVQELKLLGLQLLSMSRRAFSRYEELLSRLKQRDRDWVQILLEVRKLKDELLSDGGQSLSVSSLSLAMLLSL